MKRRSPMPPRRTRLTRKPWPVTAEQVRKSAEWRSGKTTAKRGRPNPSLVGESRARRLVRKRSNGLCEIRLNDRCTWWATDWSHRIRKSQGGPWAASNGLAACRSCHQAITNTDGHRAEYRRLGLVLDRGDNPLTEPVVCVHGRVLLNNSGGYEPATNNQTGEASAA